MFRLIKIELIKLWCHNAIRAYIIIWIVLFCILRFNFRTSLTTALISKKLNQNIWYELMGFRMFDIWLISFLIGFIVLVQFQMEHRNNMLKQIRLLPISSYYFFCIKLIALLITSFVFLMIYGCVYGVCTYYIGLTSYPDLNFKAHSFWNTIPFQLTIILKIYISLWGYLSILALLNMYIRNVILGAALIVLLWLPNIKGAWYSKYSPSNFATRSNYLFYKQFKFSDTSISELNPFQYEIYSVIILIIVLILSFILNFKKKLVI